MKERPYSKLSCRARAALNACGATTGIEAVEFLRSNPNRTLVRMALSKVPNCGQRTVHEIEDWLRPSWRHARVIENIANLEVRLDVARRELHKIEKERGIGAGVSA